MAQTLEIPSSSTGGWLDKDIDAIVDHMVHQESGGDPNAVGKKGEIGLGQIMPKTAAMYGVSPDMLRNPVVNRYLIKRYLTDLLTKYKGNMNLALEAYNAGPGRVDKSVRGQASIPASTQSYLRSAMGGFGKGVSTLIGEGTASAEEGVPIDKLSPADRLAIAKLPKPTASPTPKPEPFGARAASWLPTIGQGVGEFAGGTAGAFLGGPTSVSGLPEYAGAVAGGAGGSALGALGENQIRKAYGLPPVSVGAEAAKGGLASTIGGALPGVLRLRKAAAIMRSTGKGFQEAIEQVLRSDAALEATVGTGARKAEVLSQAPSNPVMRAYQGTRNAELNKISQARDALYRPYGFKLTPNTVKQVLEGPVGKRLELAGKPLRQSLEDEINAAPMTVNRARVILSNLKAQMRTLNPDQQGLALRAYRDVQKALENDIDSVIGTAGAAQRKVINQAFARKLDEFPNIPYERALTEPQIADQILDKGRVPVQVIEQMKSNGKVADLQRAVSVRLFKAVRDAGAKNEGERLKALQSAVSKIEPEVFDALYGKGARADWLKMAADIAAKNKKLLANPNEEAAVNGAVEEYLKKGNNLGRLKHYLLSHRIPIEVMVLAGGGFAFGGMKGLGIATGGVIGIALYDAMANVVTRGLLRAAARTSSPDATARLIIAALNSVLRAGGEHVAGSK